MLGQKIYKGGCFNGVAVSGGLTVVCTKKCSGTAALYQGKVIKNTQLR